MVGDGSAIRIRPSLFLVDPTAFNATHVAVTDVEPQTPNGVVNFNDVFAVVLAFQAEPYPFGCSDDPCRDNVANPCP